MSARFRRGSSWAVPAVDTHPILQYCKIQRRHILRVHEVFLLLFTHNDIFPYKSMKSVAAPGCGLVEARGQLPSCPFLNPALPGCHTVQKSLSKTRLCVDVSTIVQSTSAVSGS